MATFDVNNGIKAEASNGRPPPSPHSSLPYHTVQHHQQYDSSSAQQAAIASTAHHGLHALQAATMGHEGPPTATTATGPSPGPSPYAASTTGPSPGPSPYPPLNSPPNSDQQTPHSGLGLSPPSESPVPGRQPRQTRLRRACDMCSSRKVKCDTSSPRCKPCEELGVDCTYARTQKRRGPPNKHAEAAKAAKRAKFDPLVASPMTAAETLVAMGAEDASSNTRPLDAEFIAPMSLLGLFVDDFFTYIHPLAPFPHEPTFRQAFANREDKTSKTFLALIASMVGMLVASFPRSARTHLKEQQSTELYPRAIELIERCRLIALQARGPYFNIRDNATTNDAATSYFLAIAAAYTLQVGLFRRFFAEAMSIVHEMGYNRPRDPHHQPSALEMMYAPQLARSIDHIEDQIGKRIFWTLILGVRSFTQLGASAYEIAFPPPTDANPYPDKPAEVDDECIVKDHIMAQPRGTVSLLTGFNRGIDVYLTMNALVRLEFAYGLNQRTWSEQRTLLRQCLHAVKETTVDLPVELSLELSSPAAIFQAEYFADLPGYQYYPPSAGSPQNNDLRLVLQDQPNRRRQIQYDAQKANIYVSQLATRSYYVELYLNLRDAARTKYPMRTNGEETSASIAAAAIQAAAAASAEATDAIDDDMANEREAIVHDLLAVLAAIPHRNMEPNGSALINKVRQVASTLVQDSPDRNGPLAQKTQADLAQFVHILMSLEKTGGGGGGGMDEEGELRTWADLRDYQLRFAQSGGFLQQ